MEVVATAGHVDHGKSTLCRALTGMDPDRLESERARGLTIDLGYVWGELPSGARVAFVDVPGHARYLKNMLAGAGVVRSCLFVVDANEGWMPQSEEHLRCLELLGVSCGVLCITKVRLVDEDRLAGLRRDLRGRVEGTFLEGSEVVEVDALAGIGVDDVRRALDRLVASCEPVIDAGRPRLWIDRSFSVRGIGAVVTGALSGGALETGAVAQVHRCDASPYAVSVRVRGLETQHEARAAVAPGERAAVNLSGVHHRQLRRGHVLVLEGHWEPTDLFDAELTVLGALDHPVGARGAYELFVGTARLPVRLRVLGQAELAPGVSGAVRVRLPGQLPLVRGDRFVLREDGRNETVGGGEVLDVAPVLSPRRAAPDRSVFRVVRERGFVDSDTLWRLTGARCEANVGRWVVDRELLSNRRAALTARLSSTRPRGLDLADLDELDRAILRGIAGVEVRDGRARLAEWDDEDLERSVFLGRLRAEPFSPPTLSEVGAAKGEVAELRRRGLVVDCAGIYFAREALERSLDVAAELAADPNGFTVASFKGQLNTSRRFALALLAYLDANGYTRLREGRRYAGPVLARARATS